MAQRKGLTRKQTPWQNEGGGLLSRINSRGERVWAVRVQRKDRTRPLETFGVGQRAKLAAEKRIQELRAARYEHRVPVEYGRYTFGQAADDALPGLNIDVGNEKDKRTKESRVQKLQGRYGDLRLSEINEAHSTDCKVWLLEEEGLSAKTVNAYLDLFKKVLDHAVADRKLETNPLLNQKRLKKGDPMETRNPLTPEEWEAVMKHTRPGWFQDALVGLAQSGMRRSELVNLDWEDIDFKNNRIVVRARSITRQEGRRRVKSHAGNRSVPMTSQVKKVLQENRKRGARYPFPGSHDDQRIVHSTLGNDWDNLRQRLHEDNIIDIRHKRIHDLRHTYGVWSVNDGVPLTALRVIMGHSSIEQTANYAAINNEEAIQIWHERSRFGGGKQDQSSDR